MTMKSLALRGLRYVHIEESEAEVARVQHTLQAGGYEPQPLMVQTADELAAAMEQPGWDLILTDLTLTTFSAQDALAQLADRVVDLPVIVVSGVAGEEEAVDALKAGAHDYVMKGRLARLAPAVQQALREADERKARRQAEQALARTTERLELATRAAGIGVWDWNIPENKLIWDNRMFALYGVKEEDFGGAYDAWLSGVHPDDRARCDEAIQQALRNEKPYDIEFRIRWPDGAVHTIKADGLVVWDSQGRSLRMTGTNYDITARKRAESRLFTTQYAVDHATDYIFVIGNDGYFLDVNESACHRLGYTKQELLTQSVMDIDPDFSQVTWKSFWEEFKQTKRLRLETRHRSKSGEIYPVEIVSNYILHEGQELDYAFVRDITERKQAEATLLVTTEHLRQAQKMEAIGRLAGGIAHNFNNLLMVINGQSQLLLSDQAVPNDIKHKLEQIQDAGQQATGLTRQLLVITRQQILQSQIVNINQILTAMQRFLTRLMGADIEVRFELDKSLGHIMMDPSQLEQIIMNLTTNARDAMPDGGTVTLKTRNVELDAVFFEQQSMVPRPGHYCLLSVQDTGTGMDEQTAGRVFEPFFTKKGLGRGTGLGLSTVYGVVQQGQGVITLSTQLGQGSTFRVYFPNTTGAARQEEVAVSTPAADVRGTETILLVEDEPLVRQFFYTVLSSQGYTVLEAATGKEAREISSSYQGEIHLVLSDVILLDERGPDVVTSLKMMRPGVKVLFMSGYLGVESDQERCELQDSQFLQKPISLPVLVATIRRIFDLEGMNPTA